MSQSNPGSWRGCSEARPLRYATTRSTMQCALVRLAFIVVAASGCGARTELEIVRLDGPCAFAPATPVAISPLVHAGYSYYPGAALTVTTDHVYFDTGVVLGTARSGISRVAIAGGAPDAATVTVFPTNSDYFAGPLAQDGTDLYFPSAPSQGMPGEFNTENVLAESLEGGPLRMLAHPVQPTRALVNDLSTNGTRGVFWLEWNGQSTDSSRLAHWDGSKLTTVSSFSEPAATLAVDADRAFVATSLALYAVPLSAGPSAIHSVLREDGNPPQLLGLNGDALFYSPDATSIVRRELVSGAETTLVTGAALALDYPAARRQGFADSAWLYYAAGPSGRPRTLFRVKVGGGPPEVIWDDPNRPPTGAVATDACNIYWLTASAPWDSGGGINGPSLLMARAKR